MQTFCTREVTGLIACHWKRQVEDKQKPSKEQAKGKPKAKDNQSYKQVIDFNEQSMG